MILEKTLIAIRLEKPIFLKIGFNGKILCQPTAALIARSMNTKRFLIRKWLILRLHVKTQGTFNYPKSSIIDKDTKILTMKYCVKRLDVKLFICKRKTFYL